MATETPKQDNTRGEDDVKPRFTGENNPTGYDDEAAPSRGSVSYSSGSPWGGRQSGRSSVAGNSTSSPATRPELKDKESNPTDGANTAVGDDEKSLGSSGGSPFSSSTQGGSWNYRNNDNGRGFGLFGNKTAKGKFRLNFKTTKKRIATWAIIGLVGGGGIYSFSILSGPFQFVHMAQNLQKHFRSNEDFGNDRTSKILLYALAGKGAQNGRLGVMGNMVANKWEKRLLDNTGLRPVYQEPSRRFIGFEIVNDAKAQNFLGDLSDRNQQRLEKSMGRGAEIKPVGERTTIVRPNGERLSGNQRFVDLTDVSNFGDRRTWIKTIGSASNTNKVSSAVGSRLLIKRAGVDFHPLNKARGKLDEAAATRLEKKREDNIQNGVKDDGGVKANPSQDSDGDGTADSASQEDVQASEETKNYINDFKSSGAFKTGASATVIVGVMCAAKGYGDSIDEYKHQNVLLPMIRMGVAVISLGNQVMAGNDIDLSSLGVYVKYLHDKEKRTSWNQAESIRAAEGKKGGKPISREADLRNAGDKPAFFKALDGIPALGTTCDAVNGFFNLPGIKQVSQVLGDIQEQVIDAGLGLAGAPSTDELLESSLKTAAGRSVDPKAKGAAYGSMSDAGAFLGAGDQGISMGGVALSTEERSQLGMLEERYETQERSNKSFAGRYLDPYDNSSMISSVIDNGPSSPSHLASMVSNPVEIISSGFSSLISGVFPKAEAASVYDYGVAKYGYSQRDQADPMFEDPYENAGIVMPQLDDLNDKYGKCFGMRATADSIESEDKSVNVFKLEKDDEYKDCRNDKDAEMFKRYRFYLADMVTATSLACYEGDDEACAQVGAGGTAPTQAPSGDLVTEAGEANIKKLKNPLSGSDCNCEIDPKGITLHWWGGQYGNGISSLVDIFNSNGLSVQLGITSEGEVYQLTKSLTTKTSHAIGGNSTTIGIEIEGGPEQFGKEGIEKYPEKFEAVVATVQFLKDKYNIPIRKNVICDNASGILQHSDFNKCPGAIAKSDIDDYYYNEVIKRVK